MPCCAASSTASSARADDIEREFGVTVAAAIPASPAMVRKRGALVPLVVGGPRRSRTRSTRPRRSSSCAPTCSSWTSTTRRGSIVVTSPLPGDGKSTIAANLAAALSMSDRRVVLIDGDLRRPVVAESFGSSRVPA